jgi:protein-S-isoprenylcysteine O-methyltransferase Ste14
MIATEFEYRHRHWLIALVFVFAYAFYNLDHLNIVYAIVPWNRDVPGSTLPGHLVYAAAALLAGLGATILTWATAYRDGGGDWNRTQTAPVLDAGPFAYVRNPHYLGYFLLLIGLGTFQSRPGFLVLVGAEALLFLRIMAREEMKLERDYGEHFLEYCRRIPRLLPSLRSQIASERQTPQWRQALWRHALEWGLVATLVAFACTLSDPVGYVFAGSTVSFVALQNLFQTLRTHLRDT